MQFERKEQIRRYYEPLTLSESLEVLTPDSGIGQVFDPNSGNYNPDREITPLVVVPNIQAWVKDDSWRQLDVGTLLGEKKWFVNGVNIATLSAWQGKYEIDSFSGAITIYKNTETHEKLELHFEALLPDHRRGINIPVKTPPLVLSTLDMSRDTYSVSLTMDDNIVYNPFLDKLLIWDYLTANNINAGSRSGALDENAYERTIDIFVTKGGVAVTEGYSLKLYRVNKNMALEEIVNNTDMIKLDLGNNKLTLDLRLMSEDSYLIKVVDDETGDEVGRRQFTVGRVSPAYGVEIYSSAGLSSTKTLHRNKVIVSYGKRVVPYPDPILRFLWRTETIKEGIMDWNEGSKTFIDSLRAGVGFNHTNDSMDVMVGSEMKGVFEPVTDEAGNVFTDEAGNAFITN